MTSAALSIPASSWADGVRIDFDAPAWVGPIFSWDRMAMSRDVVITVVTSVVFVAAIAGTMLYRGYSLPLSELANLDRLLVSDPGTSETPNPNGFRAPETAAPLVALADETPSEEKSSAPDLPKPKPPKSDGELSLPDNDFFDDIPLPSLDEPPKTSLPEKPKAKPPEMPSPAPPKPTAPIAVPPPPVLDLAESLPEPKPVAPQLNPAPAPPSPTLPTDIADESEADVEPNAPAALVEDSTQSVPYPSADISGFRPATTNSPLVSDRAPPAPVEPPAPRVVSTEPKQVPVATTPPPATAEPSPSSSPQRTIPAPPAYAGRPTPPEPALPVVDRVAEVGDVVAKSKPIARSEALQADSEGSEPIARATAPASSVGSAPAETEQILASDEEYRPLDRRGERYIPLGEAGLPPTANEEFYAVRSLPATPGAIAYGETTVVSVHKTGLESETPQVLAYDVTMYLALEGDSYQSISETMYGSPRLADALAQYNRSRVGPSERLEMGTRVRIPPIDVLSGASSGQPTNAGPSREAFQQVPVRAGQGAVIPPAGAPSPFDARIEKHAANRPVGPGEYRTEEIETLWSVATKTLGDGRRWREVYDANRDRLASEITVPAGVTLRIPAQP